jgi:hypothetical protein
MATFGPVYVYYRRITGGKYGRRGGVQMLLLVVKYGCPLQYQDALDYFRSSALAGCICAVNAEQDLLSN